MTAFSQRFDNQDHLSAQETTRLAQLRSRLPAVRDAIKQAHDSGRLPLLKLQRDAQDTQACIATGEAIRRNSAGLVVLGTGGSSLGGQTLNELNESGYPVWFLDNVDPHSLERFIAQQDMTRLHLLIISKSGGTVETLTQSLALIAAMQARGVKDIGARCHAITVPGASPLRELAQHFGIPVLDHDPNIGGRYSVLSNVGLIPAAAAGIDIAAIRKGAADLLDDTMRNEAALPLEGAAWAAALMPTRPVSVLMPYCDRLECFGAWYQQLWAESIGKDGIGSTPVKALGAVDQHSQLQLYLDGPKDKTLTLLTLPHGGEGTRLQAQGIKALAHLDGVTVGDVMAALQHGTIETLRRKGLPLRLMALQKADATSMGALLMHFMLETIAAAELLGINAFDQPAVEESKQLARDYLQRKKQDSRRVESAA